MTTAAQAIIDSIAQFGGPEIYPIVNPNSIYNPDLKKHLYHSVTLQANTTVGQPLFPPPPGNLVVLRLVQDSTGSRTVAWASCYRDAPNWSSGGAALSTALAVFMFDGQSYQFLGGSSAFAVQGSGLTPGAGGVSYLGLVPKPNLNPAPTAGAVAAGGVAPTVTNRAAIVLRTPLVGAVTVAGVAGNVSAYVATGPGAVVMAGQVPTRTP